MVNADQYRAMALQHHRWAGMCRSPESREEHFRLEKSSSRLRIMKNAYTGCLLRGRQATGKIARPDSTLAAPLKKIAPAK
jgi:hypothetical protein